VNIGIALASAAVVDAVNVGLSLAVSAAEDADSIGAAIASSAVTDVKNTGIMLASAASADAVSIGEALAVAAQVNAIVIGQALVLAVESDLESIGKAVTAAALKNPSSIGRAIAAAAAADAAKAGDILIVVAGENVAAAGEMLAVAADSDPDSVSESLLIAATIAIEDISKAVAKAAAVNATAMGVAISVASESNTVTTGQILANGAKEDPVAIGNVLAKAADVSPVSIGRSLNTSAVVNASAIGAALITAASADVSSIGEALAFGPARDTVALAALGREISVEPWMPEKAPRIGPSKTMDGYWVAVAPAQAIESSLVDQVLGKYADEAGARIKVQDVPEKPEDVPVPENGDKILSYVKLTAEGSTTDAVIASHVTLVIDKLWLIDGDIHPWSIQFNRYDEERAAWTPHLAKRSGESASEVYYTVAPSGFSLWSVSGREGEIPPKRFVVESLYAGSAYEGEELTVTSRVTNLTDSPQNYNAVLWLNSEAYMTRSVLIPGGLTKEMRFTLSLPAETYDLRMGRISRTLTIKQPKEVATAVVAVVPTVVAQPTIVKSATPTPEVVGATPTALPTSIAPTPVPTVIDSTTSTDGGGSMMFIIIAVVAALVLVGVALVIMKGRGGNRESE
jgi:PGF-pre-PGF domain-containing protein